MHSLCMLCRATFICYQSCLPILLLRVLAYRKSAFVLVVVCQRFKLTVDGSFTKRQTGPTSLRSGSDVNVALHHLCAQSMHLHASVVSIDSDHDAYFKNFNCGMNFIPSVPEARVEGNFSFLLYCKCSEFVYIASPLHPSKRTKSINRHEGASM